MHCKLNTLKCFLLDVSSLFLFILEPPFERRYLYKFVYIQIQTVFVYCFPVTHSLSHFTHTWSLHPFSLHSLISLILLSSLTT